MLVVDSVINGSMYSKRAALNRFRNRAAFLKLKVSSVPSVVPIMMIIHRTIKTVVNNRLLEGGGVIIASRLFIKLF